DTPWEWATQHMTAQPFPFETVPIAASVPASMRTAVMRALSKDRNMRQRSAREFFEELTIGTAGPRMSFSGAPRATGASYPEVPQPMQGGTMAISATPQPMPAAGAPRGGQTQTGEPLFASQPEPAGRTVMGMPASAGGAPVQVTGAMQAYPTPGMGMGMPTGPAPGAPGAGAQG